MVLDFTNSVLEIGAFILYLLHHINKGRYRIYHSVPSAHPYLSNSFVVEEKYSLLHRK